MSCILENRDQLIDDYIAGRLNEADEERFGIHLYECDQCLNEVDFRRDVIRVAGETRVEMPDHRGAESEGERSREFRIPAENTSRGAEIEMSYPQPAKEKRWDSFQPFLYAAVLLVLAIPALHYGTLPNYDSSAQLSAAEQLSLSIAVRAGTDSTQSSFNAAAEALLEARSVTALIFVNYDQHLVELAIDSLQVAYKTTDDGHKQNKYAYFLAKAHLMADDADAAQLWLNRIDQSVTDFYKAEAAHLRERLEAR